MFPIVGAAAGFEREFDDAPAVPAAPLGSALTASTFPSQAAADTRGALIPKQVTTATQGNVVPMRPGVFEQQPVVQPAVTPDSRRRRFAEWPITVTLVGVALAIAVSVADAFRTGALVLGAVLCLAAVFRLVLTDSDAGMLKSRSRPVDLAVLCVLAAATLGIAAWIPPPS